MKNGLARVWQESSGGLNVGVIKFCGLQHWFIEYFDKNELQNGLQKWVKTTKK